MPSTYLVLADATHTQVYRVHGDEQQPTLQLVSLADRGIDDPSASARLIDRIGRMMDETEINRLLVAVPRELAGSLRATTELMLAPVLYREVIGNYVAETPRSLQALLRREHWLEGWRVLGDLDPHTFSRPAA